MTDHDHAGSSLGLPEQGRGALASWSARLAALLVDWLASTLVALALFGPGVMVDSGWRMFMPLTVFFVESAVLTTLTGSSFGQLLARVGVTRLDGGPLGLWRPVVRSLLKCLVVPVVVVGAERRHLADLLLGTCVVRRR
ncbi:RDD family protein [uncultured Tessaracoccus sp.]|uniref:RDD family protein n=1 Tax=uncultured Tessaracoccus sp. TaxID=905023 RepID=UPI0025D57A2F|nr:RDD family protein [uncultured Tessaracoccus sp.]